MSISYNLFETPFLTWRQTNGQPIRVGFRKLLAEAGTLSTFGDAGPQTTFAVIRTLLVLMHQIRPECSDTEWQQFWTAGRFPDEWLTEIEKASTGKFDLFDPKRPFFQRVGIDTDVSEEAKDKPASYLQSHFAAGTGINHASHSYDDRVALCPSCCACGLLELPPFCGAGGSGLMASINNTPPVYFLPFGPSLFHTLLLNWPLADRVAGDHPQWERGKASNQIGILEGFTWQPRTVRLFPKASEGQSCTNCGNTPPVLVRRIVFSKGVPASKERLEGWRDPHVYYREDDERKKQIRSLTPPEPDKRPVAALGFWREEVAALLRVADDGDPGCLAIARARELNAKAGRDLTVFCVVPFTRPGQDKKHIVRGRLWTVPPLNDDVREQLLAELDWFAEWLARWVKDQETRKNQKKTEPDTVFLPDIAPLAEFERRAEEHFHKLLAEGGKDISMWRTTVRADAKKLSQPVPTPGRALETARVRQAIEEAINITFPLPPKEVTT